MRKMTVVAWRRVAVYLSVSIAGLALFIAAYCLITGRSLAEALDSFWIAMAIAFVTSAITAVRDQRKDAGTRSGKQGL
ncbi:hypothetical protein [Glutamicibacter arilaitensis]|uniref:hypothetical protein n=1 Tax=Glutamicibacter arilaitensis TaxID=256701 RepID=UPI003A8F3EF4